MEQEVIDLGDSILMPGLVNAHCHLEFGAAAEISSPSFTKWARQLHPEERGHRGPPLQDRIKQVLRGGSTTVANHCSPETDSFETPFRRVNFWEVLGSDPDRARKSLELALKQAERFGGYVTPHSLYAVHREVLEAIFKSPRAPLSLHLLESSDENQFFREGRGPLADLIRERGGAAPIPDTSPIHWLHHVGAPFMAPGRDESRPYVLLVHGNYLQPTEIQLLQTSGASVIHCPGSHRFFGHQRFSYEALRNAGIQVGLGTDSLASNAEISMLREMRLFHEAYPEVAVEEIVKMATLDGAKALGLESEIGSIEIGKKADLVAVLGRDLMSASEASFAMIAGKRII
jgi:cytosine/adenosine deaminase-related metal-dependent hydrolase